MQQILSSLLQPHFVLLYCTALFNQASGDIFQNKTYLPVIGFTARCDLAAIGAQLTSFEYIESLRIARLDEDGAVHDLAFLDLKNKKLGENGRVTVGDREHWIFDFPSDSVLEKYRILIRNAETRPSGFLQKQTVDLAMSMGITIKSVTKDCQLAGNYVCDVTVVKDHKMIVKELRETIRCLEKAKAKNSGNSIHIHDNVLAWRVATTMSLLVTVIKITGEMTS